MALANLFPAIDNTPPSHGETFVGNAAVDLTLRTGKPPAPTAAVILSTTTAGTIVLTMLGGGNVSFVLPAASLPVYIRIAVTAIVSAPADGVVTALWNYSPSKNP